MKARFQLERSADGSYEVRLESGPKGLSTTGKVLGGAVGPVVPDATPRLQDEVVAERLGDPGIRLCGPLPRSAVNPSRTTGR